MTSRVSKSLAANLSLSTCSTTGLAEGGKEGKRGGGGERGEERESGRREGKGEGGDGRVGGRRERNMTLKAVALSN